MKKDNKIDIQVEGELQFKADSQNQTPMHTASSKSEGNTPSDLGAIKKTQLPTSASNSDNRSNLQRPGLEKTMADISENSKSQETQGKTTKEAHHNVAKNGKSILPFGDKTKISNPKDLNPLLNTNKMKGFNKKQQEKDPKINPSAEFLNNSRQLPAGKKKVPNFINNIMSSRMNSKKKNSVTEKLIQKKAGFSFVDFFMTLPIQAKIAFISIGFGFVLILIVVIVVIATNTSSADGNRELKDFYLEGDYTDEQLCEYLVENGYISSEEGHTCESTPAYQFFTNFKDLMEEYEEKYVRYRFNVNLELLYETMAFYKSDEEFYEQVTSEELEKLINALLEEIEESCVIKTYDKKTKVCTEKKYVYTLYEISLNKYISYLKYGDTSTHPNYGNDENNTSKSGTAVQRICGEGKNTDYIFGYGLVSTSSSPLAESSDCPNNPVVRDDYKKLKATWTTLEDLGTFGGVPYFSHRYSQILNSETLTENGTASSETTKNVIISPSHQNSNMYSGGVLSEKASMYALATYLKSELESRGYNVFVTQENDGTNGYNSQQTKSGIEWLKGSTGVYIALHSNATANGGLAWGPVTLYDPNQQESIRFSNIVCNHMEKLYKNEGRQTRSTCAVDTANRSEVGNFYRFGGSGGSTLVEVGFHDNPNEATWITQNYSKIAASLADAIEEYVGNE